LIWAYADEIVLAASSSGPARFVGDGPAMSGIGRERLGGGAINGWYEPHEDALLIHAKLLDWFSGDGLQARTVMTYAERRQEMPAEIVLPRVKAMPVLDRNGDVLVERRRAHRKDRVVSQYCLVEFAGLDPAVADRREQQWRDFHALFVAFLDVMAGFPLKRWKITKRGLTTVGESLT